MGLHERTCSFMERTIKKLTPKQKARIRLLKEENQGTKFSDINICSYCYYCCIVSKSRPCSL